MITSESHNDDIHWFFRMHNPELARRLLNLINKKYGHTLVKLIQRGAKIPPIFGTYKVDDSTFYGFPVGLSHSRNGFFIESVNPFLVMKDLRNQTRIMVTNSHPHAIIYSTHAISRYRERLGFPEDMDFVDICKDMYFADCTGPRIMVDCGEVYGTDINCRALRVFCSKGVFLGYMSSDTEVLYAETFLSPNELREDQEYMDPNKNPYLKKWDESREISIKGKTSSMELENDIPVNAQITIENGKMKILSEEEIKAKSDRFDQKIKENPNFFEDQLEPNRQKAINRIKRKGYK